MTPLKTLRITGEHIANGERGECNLETCAVALALQAAGYETADVMTFVRGYAGWTRQDGDEGRVDVYRLTNDLEAFIYAFDEDVPVPPGVFAMEYLFSYRADDWSDVGALHELEDDGDAALRTRESLIERFIAYGGNPIDVASGLLV